MLKIFEFLKFEVFVKIYSWASISEIIQSPKWVENLVSMEKVSILFTLGLGILNMYLLSLAFILSLSSTWDLVTFYDQKVQ